jgi:hypothetical protein
MQDSTLDRVRPTRRMDKPLNQGNALESINVCVGATIFLVQAPLFLEQHYDRSTNQPEEI